jgi:hypothetical protein
LIGFPLRPAALNDVGLTLIAVFCFAHVTTADTIDSHNRVSGGNVDGVCFDASHAKLTTSSARDDDDRRMSPEERFRMAMARQSAPT